MQINAAVFIELLDEMIHDAKVEIVATEERVAARRADLEHAVAHIEDRNVERAAAQIIDCDNFIFLFIESVCQRGSRRLVDDTQHFETRDLARVFGRVALRVVEIRGDSDDRLRDRLAEIRFRVAFDLAEDHR